MKKRAENIDNADNTVRTGLSQTLRRRFRFGSNMLVLMALAIVLFIVLNLVMEHFSTALTLDFTKEKLYSIGDVTKENLSALDKDVEIIALYDRVKGEADSSNINVIKVLDLYDEFDHVKVSYVDPDANPNFILDTVGRINAGSYDSGDYIVKCGDKTRRIPADEMYVTEYQSYSGIFSIPVRTGMQAERKLTTAVLYVAADDSPTLYYITGHGEEEITGFSEIMTYLEGLGADVKQLDLTDITEMPEDAAVAIFMGPKYDITTRERNMLQQWLEQKGGQLAVCVNPLQNGTEFANLNELLTELYALSLNNDVVYNEAKRIASAASESSFLGESVSNGPIENSSVYYTVPVFYSRSIEVLNINESAAGINHYPIIQTPSQNVAEYSYCVPIVGGERSKEGVFTVAAASQNLNFSTVTHAVVFGSTLALSDDYFSSYGNYTRLTLSIFAMSIDWMIDSYGENHGYYIDAKTYDTTQLVTTKTQSNTLGIIAAVIIPLLIIAAGIVVWVIRRHK
ncbi:MAG: Gldg family protein [Clostridia bacterium]|nr:Gldg family protein [Clostridia bacterium]